MLQRPRIPFFSWGLAAVTAVTLLANFPDTSQIDVQLWLFYAAFVALMLNLGLMHNNSVVSPASTATLMAYLTLGEAGAADTALWSVTAGALAGNLIWLLRTVPTYHTRREYARIVRSITVGVAQMILGLLAGNWLYQLAGGNLPLDRLESGDIVPLVGLVAAYLVVHVSIAFLDAYIMRGGDARYIVRQWSVGVENMLLPLPFGVVGAVAYHGLSQLAFMILIAGLLIIVTGVNRLSRTQKRFRQQVDELSALSAVSQAMRSNMSQDALLQVVYEQVARLLAADNFIVAQFDAGRTALNVSLFVVGGEPQQSKPPRFHARLIEHVSYERAPLLLSDQVARQTEALGIASPDEPIYSWLGVPLLVADRVLGCIAVYSTNPQRHFTSSDMHLLATLANQTGIALDNTLLYDEARGRSAQLATLNNVVTLLSGTLDVQQVYDLVSASAVAAASCNAVALYMWHGEDYSPLSLVRHNGLSELFVSDPPRPLILDIDNLQRRRQALIVTDAAIDQRTRDVRPVMRREYKRSWAEFLLRKGDDLLGVLVFYFNDVHHFSAEEKELLRNFTNQSALAISNARLYTQTDEALKRRVEQLSALADTSRELTSTLDLKGLFQLVLERAIEATQSHVGALLLRLDEHDSAPRLVAFHGIELDDVAVEADRVMTGYIAQAYTTGTVTLVSDSREDTTAVPLDRYTLSQLNVPILRDDEVLGVIALGSDRPGDYTSEDVSFVSQLATQARIAIDNARLFRRIEIARDRLQVILDSMKEAVILIGADGSITLANPRVESLLGLPPQHIIGVPIERLLAQPDLKLAQRLGSGNDNLLHLTRNLSAGQWDATALDGERVTFEVEVGDKTRYIDRTDAPVRSDDGRAIGVLMVFSDVTEEHELIHARENLSSMIVHDLRGPLTAITTSLKLLSEIASPNESLGLMVRQTTESASRAVRKLLNLVDSLLDVSKLESGVIALEREIADVRLLCLAVVDELLPLAQELDVKVLVKMPDDLPLLDVDAEKVERVLLNLVDNAIKFTPAHGQVVIEAYPPEHIEGPGDFVRVQVRDTGPGIPDEYKERLFDRFAQVDGLKGRRRGTGLGLTFCRLAVEAHSGRIWVEDNPHGGAVFVFTLPVAQYQALPDDPLHEDA